MRKALLLFLVAGLFSACAVTPAARNNDLIRAAEQGRVDEMEKLIRAGADINGHNADGWTPYLAASSNGRFEAMRLLRGLGAKTDAPDLEQISYERHLTYKE